LTIVGVLIATISFGQEKKWDEYPYPEWRESEYSDYVSKKNQDQQDRFLDRKYTHPAKPKHKTEIGLHAGALLVNGDVHPKGPWPGTGFGLHIRRSLGYVASIRASIMGGTTHGQNWLSSAGFWVEDTRNPALTGQPGYDEFNADTGITPDYTKDPVTGTQIEKKGSALLVYNYRTQIREAVLSGILNLNNIKFHRRRNLVSWYGYGGVGALLYNTKMDMLDADNQIYDFSEFADYSVWADRETALTRMDDVLDGTYESQAERHFDDIGGIWGDNFNFQPTVHAGLGMAFKLSRMLNLGLDSKITITRDDLLDGQRWQEWGALTRDFDTYSYTSARLGINLGGKSSVEPLWWMSPLDYAYTELRDQEEIELPEPYSLKDDDGDGVPNEFDDEPDTPEGCPVTTRGVSLDSDGDGIIDCEDKQVFTPYDLIGDIDDDGVAIAPSPSCDCPAPIQEVIYQTTEVAAPAAPCDWFLPMIHFDLDKDKVKSEFYPHLHHIATAMKACPSMNVAVVGHTDSRADDDYNNDLSCRRAQAAIDYLVANYGVDRYRFTKSYSGKTSNLVAGAKNEGEHYLNRRVEFLTGGAAGMYTDLGACPGRGGTISGDSYYGTGSGSSIFIDK